MFELETRIAEWRARMTVALPQRDEAVVELEEHLREHLASLQQQGRSADEAFALATARMGEPQAVAREFDRMPAGWRPGLVMLPVLAALLAAVLGYSLWNWSRHFPVTAFQVTVSVTLVTGYFGVLGAGLIAASAVVTSWWRPFRERERRAVRRLLGKLALLAVIALPIGLVLGTIWRAQFVTNQWTLWSYHLRLIGSMVSAALLMYAQSRPAASDRVRWLTAILAALVLFFSGFGPRIRVADIPVAWLCAVFLAGQVLLALPRFRIVRVRETT